MPRRTAEPSEVTIEYLIPVYIVIRRDEALYGDNDRHIARVVVDDEAELANGSGFSPPTDNRSIPMTLMSSRRSS